MIMMVGGFDAPQDFRTPPMSPRVRLGNAPLVYMERRITRKPIETAEWNHAVD